ncbi:MAG: gephyrin-like molybdotransferase Glp [Solirubrobacterales bacterium]
MNLFNVISPEDVIKILQDNADVKLNSEKISLLECYGRILYEDIISDINLPEFKKSTVDGYAVRSKDVFGASETSPSMLDLSGEVSMGVAPEHVISFPGECMYVPTGGMLPNGTDGVVMIENTDKLDDVTILCNKPVAPGENVVQEGEDISKGEVVLKKGIKLRPYEAGVLAGIGCLDVNVIKKPRVGIISTGDEIVSPDKEPLPGQVRDINTYLLNSMVMESGGEPIVYGFVKDDFDSLKGIFGKALEECDLVLISGGSSVGKKDETLNVINSFPDSMMLVHGISIKPGKPTIIGKVSNKVIFGLPGHPLACAVVFKAFVDSYINILTGSTDVNYPIECEFEINYHKAKGREEYLPVTIEIVNGVKTAKPVFSKSGLITGFSKAFGYIKIDRNIEGLSAGQLVQVYKF